MKRTLIPILLLLMLTGFIISAQEDAVIHVNRTVGTIFGQHDDSLLFTSQTRNDVYLVDDQGHIVNQWEVSGNGRDAWLLENGNILVSVTRQEESYESFADDAGFVGIDGRFEEYTWDGDLVWAYEPNIPGTRVHHGVTPMPNGNILFIVWKYTSNEEAIQAGRNPELLGDGLWRDIFIEYNPELDEIVWEWDSWDHLVQDFDPEKDHYGVVADNPQKINLNYYDAASERIEDWIHANSMDYNPELDQIAISAREQSEIWVVDHSKSTEELRGEDGDLLYRWGNPQVYGRGTPADRHLFFQHDVQWNDAGLRGEGNLMAYSNRNFVSSLNSAQAPFYYSTVVEVVPSRNEDGTYVIDDEAAYVPLEPNWVYNGFPHNFFSSTFISGVQRLPNGNTLINKGQQAQIFEVTEDGDVVWLYEPALNGNQLTPQGSPLSGVVFRTRRYAADYPAFEERDLTPGLTVEDLAGSSQDLVGVINTHTSFSALMTDDITERYYSFVAQEGEGIDIYARGIDTNGVLSMAIVVPETEERLVESSLADDDMTSYLAHTFDGRATYWLVLTVDSNDADGRYGVSVRSDDVNTAEE